MRADDPFPGQDVSIRAPGEGATSAAQDQRHRGLARFDPRPRGGGDI